MDDTSFIYPFKCWLNKKDYPLAKVPTKKYKTDAGFDISSAEKSKIYPGETVIVHTGVHFEIVPGWEIQIRSRSGLAAKNAISVLNSPATIDAGYTGELMVILNNAGKAVFNIEPGDRIAQLVFQKVPLIEITEVEPPVEQGKIETRGSNGIGSTGVK